MNTRAIIAWGILAGSLVFLAEVDATSELAVSFAYLILLGVALTVGPAALGNITNLVAAPAAPPTTGGTSGGGSY